MHFKSAETILRVLKSIGHQGLPCNGLAREAQAFGARGRHCCKGKQNYKKKQSATGRRWRMKNNESYRLERIANPSTP